MPTGPSTITTADLARELARRRWTNPAVVEQRVAALAAHIARRVAAMPPLTPGQRERLALLLTGAVASSDREVGA